jgi:hypothetical protein
MSAGGKAGGWAAATQPLVRAVDLAARYLARDASAFIPVISEDARLRLRFFGRLRSELVGVCRVVRVVVTGPEAVEALRVMPVPDRERGMVRFLEGIEALAPEVRAGVIAHLNASRELVLAPGRRTVLWAGMRGLTAEFARHGPDLLSCVTTVLAPVAPDPGGPWTDEDRRILEEIEREIAGGCLPGAAEQGTSDSVQPERADPTGRVGPAGGTQPGAGASVLMRGLNSVVRATPPTASARASSSKRAGRDAASRGIEGPRLALLARGVNDQVRAALAEIVRRIEQTDEPLDDAYRAQLERWRRELEQALGQD